MNEKTIKQMVRDISGVSYDMDETQNYSMAKSKMSGTTTPSSIAKKPHKKNKSMQGRHGKNLDNGSPKREATSINIRIKPVEETFNSIKNRNKFCFPCGEASARVLEQTFQEQDKQILNERSKRAKAKKGQMNNKNL